MTEYNKQPMENNTCVDLRETKTSTLREDMFPDSVVNFLVDFIPENIELTRKCNIFVTYAPNIVSHGLVPNNVKIYYDVYADISFKPLVDFALFSESKSEFTKDNSKSWYFFSRYYMEEIKEIELCGKIHYTTLVHRKLGSDGTDEMMTGNEKNDVKQIIKILNSWIFCYMPYLDVGRRSEIKISENSRWWHVETAVKNYLKDNKKFNIELNHDKTVVIIHRC